MDKTAFLDCAKQGYKLIPLSKRIKNPDIDPIDLYEFLSDTSKSYLFESVEGGRKWSRYTIIGLPTSDYVDINGQEIDVFCDGVHEKIKSDNPVKWIEEYHQTFKVYNDPNLPEFQGGLVGYFSFDSICHFESCIQPSKQIDDLKTPDIQLIISKEILIFDKLNNMINIIIFSKPSESDYYKTEEKINKLIYKIKTFQKINNTSVTSNIKNLDIKYHLEREDFISAVKKIKSYITDGDVMQVVLSQRMSIDFEGKPVSFYRKLRDLNPSPYMYYLNLGDFNIIGSSPEILVRLEGDNLTVRPIAGTRPRSDDLSEDSELERDLKNDPKEIAEHLMLIDLGRNDIGRVSEIGSVHLTDKMIIEKYSHVMHMVSNVTSKLKNNQSLMDVLRATFPAGTVSGAPKIRAIEIIYELEPIKRGIYAGAIGYLGWNGNMDTAIAIRTCIIKNSLLNIQCGAGIVYDSIPENEWEETINKGKAIIQAYKNLHGDSS